MNLTYINIDVRRQIRSVRTLLFTILMPVFMYLLFGAHSDYGNNPLGRGNTKFYVMTSMAAYGTVIAAVSVAAGATNEAISGWGRQISLTRSSAMSWVVNKTVVALTVATVSQGLVFLVGWATGATTEAWVWVTTFVLGLVGSVIFAAWGLGAALLIKSDSSEGIASSTVVFFSFLGNVFTPLSGIMLTIAKFTPMYGFIGVVRWPQMGGTILDPTAAQSTLSHPWWLLVANVVAWLAVFLMMAVLGLRRSRARQ